MATKASTTAPPLAEYALGWSLHQLAPFLDKAVGVAGAMDHRMIDRPYDWYVRLPLALLCLVRPNSHVLLVAHVVNIVCWFDRMPAVWDYMCWCALLELTFVGAAFISVSSEEVSKRFLPAVRAQLVVLYFSAAFWKLTTSWFDTHYSCATVLMSELLAGLEPLLPPLTHVAELMMLGAPALVAGIEFAVPTLLVLRPRWGVLLALVFHQTINLMPTTYAGGFSISMCCRLLIFLPGCLSAVHAPTLPLASAGLVGLATAFMYTIHGGLDFHGGIFLALALFYFLVISAEVPAATAATLPPPASFALPKMLLVAALFTYGSYASCSVALALLTIWAPLSPLRFVRERLVGLAGVAALVGFVYGFLHPVVGVQMMASSTMYGNVKNYGGGNHLIVPTGLLQSWLADGSAAAARDAPTWLVDGFGGGFVRVEYTNASALKQLAVHGADVTEQLPPRARQLLRAANASGYYFEFYAARNYFDRKGDLEACALNALEADEASVAQKQQADPPYVVPAYELRRALALQRHRPEAFELQYTRLPPALGQPTQWRGFVGPTVVYTEGVMPSEPSACTLVTPPKKSQPSARLVGRKGEACDAAELVYQPPPSWLLSKVLLPYPIPLLEGAGDGVHCTT